jgi:hypothetical protein
MYSGSTNGFNLYEDCRRIEHCGGDSTAFLVLGSPDLAAGDVGFGCVELAIP